MSVFDFVYIIGCGVAAIMCFYGLIETNKELEEEKQANVCTIFFGSALLSFLSWAVPIWWIGFEVYKRLGEKK